MNSLAHLTLIELDNQLKDIKRTEQFSISEVVRYLSEVDVRRAYLEFGYSSLFTYCTDGLRYSAGAAQRRIQAARTLPNHPEVLEKLKSGALSLCAVAEAAKVTNVQDRAVVLSKSEGKSRDQVAILVAEYQAPKPVRRERITARKVVVDELPIFAQATSTVEVKKTEVRYGLTADLDAETVELMAKAEALTGISSNAELIKRALKELVVRRSPEERMKQRKARAERPRKAKKAVETSKPSIEPKKVVVTRHMPAATRDMVFIKDGGRCSYVGGEHRCTETRGLEIDHCRPWGMGGDHSPENLRLLCSAHNQLMAEKVVWEGAHEQSFKPVRSFGAVYAFENGVPTSLIARRFVFV